MTDSTGTAVAPGAGYRRPALSPSRAADFKQCPLLYRFRVIDRLPETPTRVQARGTVVHEVLQRLFALPAGARTRQAARDLVTPAWQDVLAGDPQLDALFAGPADPELAQWLESARALLDGYFLLEDPKRLQPEACELLVEGELPDAEGGPPLVLRGYIDRLDVAANGAVRVVDYKTGSAPRQVFEARALFQMKFYALVLLRTRGVLPRQLRLLYLADQQALTYAPEAAELARFERTLGAIWSAILRAGRSGDFRPSPGKLCTWCDHQPRCPAFGGQPPPYPGWPGNSDRSAQEER